MPAPFTLLTLSTLWENFWQNKSEECNFRCLQFLLFRILMPPTVSKAPKQFCARVYFDLFRL